MVCVHDIRNPRESHADALQCMMVPPKLGVSQVEHTCTKHLHQHDAYSMHLTKAGILAQNLKSLSFPPGKMELVTHKYWTTSQESTASHIISKDKGKKNQRRVSVMCTSHLHQNNVTESLVKPP